MKKLSNRTPHRLTLCKSRGWKVVDTDGRLGVVIASGLTEKGARSLAASHDKLDGHEVYAEEEFEVVLEIEPVMGQDGKPDPARVSQIAGMTAWVEGIPVPVSHPSTYGPIEGLPGLGELEVDTLYVVSLFCAQALREQGDPRANHVVCPATGSADGAIRDRFGRLIGVTKLVLI